jgi:hypothetical protein
MHPALSIRLAKIRADELALEAARRRTQPRRRRLSARRRIQARRRRLAARTRR